MEKEGKCDRDKKGLRKKSKGIETKIGNKEERKTEDNVRERAEDGN